MFWLDISHHQAFSFKNCHYKLITINRCDFSPSPKCLIDTRKKERKKEREKKKEQFFKEMCRMKNGVAGEGYNIYKTIYLENHWQAVNFQYMVHMLGCVFFEGTKTSYRFGVSFPTQVEEERSF